MTGKAVNLLEPNHLSNTHNVRMENGVIIADGDDPFMVFRPKALMGFGCYAADLDIEEINGDIRPRLYVNSGGGFTQRSSEIMRRTSAGHYRIYFCAVGKVRAIRFDPSDFGCEFRLRQFIVRRVSPVTFFARVLRNGENPGEEKPKFRRLRKAATKIVRSGLTYERVEGLGRNDDRDLQFARWKSIYDFDETQEAACREAVAALATKPLISVVMPVYNTPVRLLEEVVASVKAQIYPNWELCIADDASSAPHIRPMLEKYAAEDPRIKVAFREKNGHIAAATNSAFELVSGDYVALLDHDDELRLHALAEVAFVLAKRPDAELIYSDEDKIDQRGRRFDPYFKPQWNPELLLCQNYFNHLTVHRTENIRKAGGWRPGFDGSQDWDLNLRITGMIDPARIVHIPKILYHWRATESSAASDATQKGYAVVNGGKALEDHLARTGIAGTVEEVQDTTWFRVRRSLPDPAPKVSIMIPTKNGRDILKQCIDSIRQRTDYPDYEIIVIDNNSDEPASLSYFRDIAAKGYARVIPYPHPFNYSAINNFAARHASGSLLVLLNNDIEVISRGWLREMAALALAPGAGCVGAMLYYPDETIQHAGIVLGIGGVAGHSHKRFDRGRSGYYGMLKLPHNVSAVTGACLMVSKAIYEEVGGLDEENLKVAFNDVDFCLKVREAGYRNVWTPFAELYHHESLSRGIEDTPEKKERFKSEVLHMLARWGDTLRQDPYYSPHLTLRREDFSLKLE